MEINAEYLRELADVKASILEVVDYILNSCEISAKEGRYSKLFKHLDNSILDMDEMEKVMNILNKKGLKIRGLNRDSISFKYSFEVSWEKD